jgi:hypothetical protein
MTQAQQAVVHARQALKSAEAAQAQEQRRENEQKLQAVIAAGREAKEEFRRLERHFKRAEAKAALRQSDLDALNQRLIEHLQEKPDVVDFPTDDEVEAWEKLRLELTQARDEAASEARTAVAERDQLRLPAMAAAERHRQCAFAARNLQNKIADPQFPRGWQGGVASVS